MHTLSRPEIGRNMKSHPLVTSSSRFCKFLWNSFSYQKETAPPVVWKFSDGQGSQVKPLLLSRQSLCRERQRYLTASSADQPTHAFILMSEKGLILMCPVQQYFYIMYVPHKNTINILIFKVYREEKASIPGK